MLLKSIFLFPCIFLFGILQAQTCTWEQTGATIAGDAEGDMMGYPVCLNADGSIIAIGAISNDGNGDGSGQVKVFGIADTVWEQIGSDIYGETPGDESGYGLSINADGSIVAIGAPYHNNSTGNLRIFQYTGENWQQVGNNINGEAAGDRFGWSVSVSADGHTVAAGAILNDGNGADAGHTRVYRLGEGNWQQMGSDIDGEAESDWSGYAVSLSSDGSMVAVGAKANGGNGYRSGHVRICQFTDGSWQQLGDDIDGENIGDNSGAAVSLSADGLTVAIGANGNDDNGVDAGHVRVFHYDDEYWEQTGDDIDGEVAGDISGISVSLSADGSVVAIGSDANNHAGGTRIFR